MISPRLHPWLPVLYLAAGVAWVLGSDYLLGRALGGHPTLSLAGSIVGLLFVALSSLLLFFLRRPIALFVVAACGIMLAGRILYEHQATEIHRAASEDLGNIADMEARQVQRWREDLLLAIENAGRNPYLTSILLGDAPAGERSARLRAGLDALRKSEGWTSLQLFDVDGRPLETSGEPVALEPRLRQLARGALVTGRVVESDLYVPGDATAGRPVLDYVVALSDARAPGDHNLGVLVARLDPESVLFPLIQNWPSGSSTADVLLYRFDRDGVRRLSPLPAGAARAGTADSFAMRIAREPRGAFEAVDDRGVPVIARVRPVDGTSWWLLAKANRDEVYEPLARLARLAIGLGLASLFATAGLVWLLWRSERRALAMRAVAAEQRADALGEHFATAGRLINDIVFLLDDQGRILDANDRAEQAFGYTRAELSGMTVQDLRPHGAEDSAVIRQRFDEIRRRGALAFRAVYRRKDGSEFPAEVSTRRLDVNGRPYVQSIVRDVTEREEQARRLAEVATERNEWLARMRLQFEHMPIGCLVVIGDAGRVEVNPAFERILGYGADELNAGDPFAAFVPPARMEQVRARLDAVMRGDGPSTTAGEFIAKSGRQVTCRWTATAIRDAGGRPIALLAMCEDISEQVAAERALRSSEERFRVLAEVSPVGIFRLTLESEIAYANARILDILGHRSREELAEGYVRSIHADDLGRIRDSWRRYVSGARTGTYRDEYRVLRPDGTVVWILLQVATEWSLDGEPEGYVGTVTDITDLKLAQRALEDSRELLEVRVAERTRELRAAKEEAERADRVKTAFLSTMSHELRTPLNSILGFTDVILQDYSGPLTDGQRRQLGIVRDSAAHLRALIEDVLDISRIEAGQLGLEIGEFDAADLLRRRVAAFEADAARKSLELAASIADDVGRVRSDAKRIGQILNNLLSNAIKFTDRGRISVRARRSSELLEIEVEDTGIGIPADGVGRLFNPFTQVAQPGGRVYEGTGLGLAISRRLANALGGDIRVASEPGRGSLFTVTLATDVSRRAEAAA